VYDNAAETMGPKTEFAYNLRFPRQYYDAETGLLPEGRAAAAEASRWADRIGMPLDGS